jgi:hypothetical protein
MQVNSFHGINPSLIASADAIPAYRGAYRRMDGPMIQSFHGPNMIQPGQHVFVENS